MTDNVIHVRNLHKAYGSLEVLRGVDLSIADGEAFGLLGPNGAGKSTLIHSILGLLKPDDGTVNILGTREPEQVIRQVGYLPERTSYHLQFTARENLAMLGRLSDLGGRQLHDRIETVLDVVGIEGAADRRLGTYSKGMLQRFGVAQAILHEPRILIVDEPGSGLDPGGQRDMAQLLDGLHRGGHTLLLCTHQLTEVARLCDRVGVLAGGRLDRVATLSDLERQGQSMTMRVDDLPAEVAGVLTALGPQVQCSRGRIVLFPTSPQLQRAVLSTLLDADVQILAMSPAADALEQFYLQTVKQQIGSDEQHGTLDPPPIEEETFQAAIGRGER